MNSVKCSKNVTIGFLVVNSFWHKKKTSFLSLSIKNMFKITVYVFFKNLLTTFVA